MPKINETHVNRLLNCHVLSIEYLLFSLGSPAGWGWLPQDDSPLSVVGGIAGVCDAQTGWPVLFTCSTDAEKNDHLQKKKKKNSTIRMCMYSAVQLQTGSMFYETIKF